MLEHGEFGADKFDGMLVYHDERWVVLCNLDKGNKPGSTRERFTIAHELGHFHIPEHRRQLMAGCRSHGSNAGAFDGADSVEELEADIFAANLLMPPARFVPKLMASRATPLATIRQLRETFDTSWESTAIQAMRHEPKIMAIAKWSSEGLEWHRIEEASFHAAGYRRFKVRELSSLPRDSATALALSDPDDSRVVTIRDCVVTADYLFDRVAAGGKRDVMIREEAVKNGRFGVLTVFSKFEC